MWTILESYLIAKESYESIKIIVHDKKGLGKLSNRLFEKQGNQPKVLGSVNQKARQIHSDVYDKIYSTDITDDFEIDDGVIKNMRTDIGFYFHRYAGGDDENKRFTENISIYLALIVKRPLHPFSEDKSDEVHYSNGEYYCRPRMTSIHDEKSLCRYCVCKNVGFSRMFY